MSDYYKAYEKRYEVVHKSGSLWEIDKPTLEVYDTILKYNIKKNSKILDIGCGEGRDARYLLDKGYNVLGIDCASSAIKKCNELTNYSYEPHFKCLDFINDSLNDKFDFIYSVCVVHMLLEETHRDSFYKFIFNHLKNEGIALIIAMGNGQDEYKSKKEDAYKKTNRVNVNTKENIKVVNTSCRIKNFINMKSEIERNNLEIVEYELVHDLPGFSSCLVFALRKNTQK